MSNDGCSRKIVIGFALLEKKHRSFMQESLLSMAQEHGIDLVAIDPHQTLVQQGPFHAILHKIPNDPEWNQQLASFASEFPYVVIIDPPHAIEKLNNRTTMLSVVDEIQNSYGSFIDETPIVRPPKQNVLLNGDDIENGDLDLRFPIIVKPLAAGGTINSHSMFLAFNHKSLTKLKPPIVLQEFINHGGVVFKVYVVGERAQCVRRKSLPDISLEEHHNDQEPILFCHISNKATLDSSFTESQDVELPPSDFISSLSSMLRKALGLRLFNFDIIRDSMNRNQYYIIDINYFPGYEKLPDYERILIDFFLHLGHEHEGIQLQEN